jgi:hypothetical protein
MAIRGRSLEAKISNRTCAIELACVVILGGEEGRHLPLQDLLGRRHLLLRLPIPHFVVSHLSISAHPVLSYPYFRRSSSSYCSSSWKLFGQSAVSYLSARPIAGTPGETCFTDRQSHRLETFFSKIYDVNVEPRDM